MLLRGLNQFAAVASYFSNVESVEFMVFLWVSFLLVFNFIVAKSASEEFIAGVALLLAATVVMLASKLRINQVVLHILHLIGGN